MSSNKEEEKEEEEPEEQESKSLSIQGTTTRYQMKKAMKIPKVVLSKKYETDFPEEYFTHEKQLDLLKLREKDKESHIQPILLKIGGYKQQDKKKGVFQETEFISLKHVVQQLIECEMKCLYCQEPVYYLYKSAREERQWTIDRINNDIGHNVGNIVISCLECNLKRRRKSKDAYLFTKQLTIHKV
jgi:hypothetical protein